MAYSEKEYLYMLAEDFRILPSLATEIIESSATYEEARKRLLFGTKPKQQQKSKTVRPRTSSAVRFV